MKKILYTILVFTITVVSAKAQDSTKTKPVADSIIQVKMLPYGKLRYAQFIINGTPLSQSSLETHLMSFSRSATELQLYKTKRRQMLNSGLICGAIAVSAIIAAGIQANQGNNQTGSLFSKAPVFCTISIGGLVGEFVTFLSPNDHLEKAIEAYNTRF